MRHILTEMCPTGMFSSRRSPPSCLCSRSSVRLCRRMRNHVIHFHNAVATALELDNALLHGQARLQRQLAAAGTDDLAQRVCKVILAHLGSPYLLANYHLLQQQLLRRICTAGGHVSENVVPKAVPYRHNEHVVAECDAAARDGGHEGPSGPPDELQSLAASHFLWLVLMSKLHSTSAWQDAFLLHSSSARGCSAYGPVLILSKHACLCQVVFCTCPQLCALADARQGLALCAVWIYTILSIEMTSPVRRSSKYPPSALTPTAAALPNSRGKTRQIGNHARPSRASATAPHGGGHMENRIRRKRSGA